MEFAAQKVLENVRWVIKPMNFVLNHYAERNLCVTKQGNLKKEKITLQRKEGDDGRNIVKMLKFKVDPTELFNY